MLASTGRATARRLAVDLSKTSTTRLPRYQQLRSILRIPSAQNGTVNQGSGITRRLLATAASNPKPPASTSTAKSTRKSTEKKPTKSAKPRVKPRAALKKPAPKKKAVAKKKAVKKTTPEQKEKAKALKERAKIRELRNLALKKPKMLPHTAFLVLGTEVDVKGTENADRFLRASTKYKSLTPDERMHYEEIASRNRTANEATYKEWVETHSPEQIRTANRARTALNRRSPGRRLRKLKDERVAPRPLPPFLLYLKDRRESGDDKNMGAREYIGQVGKEWRELPELEKRKYVDTAAESRSRYQEVLRSKHKSDVNQEAKADAAAS
ncbi:MAG: hypothetical protein M1840_007490 [Geoglossum simile]|nr:MAG: hypothetical protein M1840_007490 [Geoglossum simile]